MKSFLIIGLVLAGLGTLVWEQSAGPEHAGAVPSVTVKGDTLRVDLVRSVVRWKGTKFWGMGKHEGIVRLAEGHLRVCGVTLCGGAFVIDMQSIEVTDIPKSDPVPRQRLRNHLLSDDFFSVDAYPTAVFVLTGVDPQPEGIYRLTGDLTLRGQTHSVTFDSKVHAATPNSLEAGARFGIDRHRWGVSFRGSRLTNDLVDDEILLDLDLFARR